MKLTTTMCSLIRVMVLIVPLLCGNLMAIEPKASRFTCLKMKTGGGLNLPNDYLKIIFPEMVGSTGGVLYLTGLESVKTYSHLYFTGICQSFATQLLSCYITTVGEMVDTVTGKTKLITGSMILNYDIEQGHGQLSSYSPELQDQFDIKVIKVNYSNCDHL